VTAYSGLERAPLGAVFRSGVRLGPRRFMDGNTPAGRQATNPGENVPSWHAAGLSTVHISTPSVEWASGGSLVSLKIPWASSTPPGGSRGRVVGFSKASRRRMLRLVNSIDRRQVEPDQVLFVTLTYPGEWPRDPQAWKRHLEAFRMRLERRWGRMPVLWKLEFQKRGAPHWHLLLIVPAERVGLVRALRKWTAQAWYEVVKSGDVRHLKAGTQVDRVRTWRGVVSYCGKYLGKEVAAPCDPETGEVWSTGRIWGVWRREMLPIEMQEKLITYQQAYRMRRIIARAKKWNIRGRRGLTCFLRSDTTERILRWLLE